MSERLVKLEAKLRDMDPSLDDTTERVDLLLELAEEHFSGDDPQRLIELAEEALELSKRLGYERGQSLGTIQASAPGALV